MPRKARIDAPGALHHIIARGIEGRKIFISDRDRNDFIDRLNAILPEAQTDCYAWALMPNHFHLLLRTGTVPLATVMRRLLTGYAIAFNYRHHRRGHLFQNRYKSILCQEDTYLMELVRYIHLNPLREESSLTMIGWTAIFTAVMVLYLESKNETGKIRLTYSVFFQKPIQLHADATGRLSKKGSIKAGGLIL